MLILQPYKTQKLLKNHILLYIIYTRNFIGYESYASSEIHLRDVEAIFCQIQDEKILSANSKNEFKMDILKVLAYPVDRNHYSSLFFPSVIQPLWPLKDALHTSFSNFYISSFQRYWSRLDDFKQHLVYKIILMDKC